ncbi:MAG: hypothetical protein JJ863_24680 [Deltaproteobacteria bacterium]|nr:hypothetical protein [Deltaproteobacteria bacterium]
MGTDVDFWIERRVGADWVWVEPPAESFFATYGRPYRLFSLLLGRPVGRFSGAHALPRIAPTRGFPSDLSTEARRWLTEWQDHWRDTQLTGVRPEDVCNPSWLMADEVLAYDWDQEVRETAWAFTAQVGAHRGADGAVELSDQPCARVAFGREGDAARVLAEPDAPWVLFSSFVVLGHPNRPEDPVPDWVTQVYRRSTVREYVGCAEEFLDGVRALGPPSEIRLTYLADQ